MHVNPNFQTLKNEIAQLLRKYHFNGPMLNQLNLIDEVDKLRLFVGDLEFNQLKSNWHASEQMFTDISEEIDRYSKNPNTYAPIAGHTSTFKLSFWIEWFKSILQYFFYDQTTSHFKSF